MTRYIALAEYFWLAEQVTGVEVVVLATTGRPELADSALHAPAASFGGHDFYAGMAEKAAVLVCRLAWNHPLPDGNKRAAWAALRLFLDLNGAQWEPAAPDVNDAEAAMLAIAAHEVDEKWTERWLRTRVRFPDEPDWTN